MAVSIALLGDIMLDREVRVPRLLYHAPSALACVPGARPVPLVYPNTESSRDWLDHHGVDVSLVAATSHCATCRPLSNGPTADERRNPLGDLSALLNDVDVVIANLETPLSKRGRPWKVDAAFRADPAYAAALAEANITHVTCANNHAMDFGEVAFADSLDALRQNGIVVAGAGLTYEEARQPALSAVNGTRIGLLAYNMTGPDDGYASPGVAGVAPLNLLSLEEDVSGIRAHVDVLIAALHWGIENVTNASPQIVWLAHWMADLGFDLIVGWHPHVPGPIEFFKNSLVCYSMGNCVFGHGHAYWTDNIIAIVQIEDNRVQGVRVIPIDTAADRVFRPAIAGRMRGDLLLRRIATRSVGTRFTVADGPGAVVRRASDA